MSVSDMEGRTLGYGPCPCCDFDKAPYRVNKKGHLYVYCPIPADGGCGSGSQSRSDLADTRYAKRITKWNRPEDRKRFLAATGTPEPEPEPEKPAPTPTPAPQPAPAPAPAKATPWWDREL